MKYFWVTEFHGKYYIILNQFLKGFESKEKAEEWCSRESVIGVSIYACKEA